MTTAAQVDQSNCGSSQMAGSAWSPCAESGARSRRSSFVRSRNFDEVARAIFVTVRFTDSAQGIRTKDTQNYFGKCPSQCEQLLVGKCPSQCGQLLGG